MVKEEKEDFMVAHIVHSPSENEMCASACFGHFKFKFESFLYLLCHPSPPLEVPSPQMTDYTLFDPSYYH